MHRPRCIITADCQLLFNQMYEKRDSSRPSLFKAYKKEAEHSIKVDLSYAALWPMKAKLSLQINGIQKARAFMSESLLSGRQTQTGALSPLLRHRVLMQHIQPGSCQAFHLHSIPSAGRSLSRSNMTFIYTSHGDCCFL